LTFVFDSIELIFGETLGKVLLRFDARFTKGFLVVIVDEADKAGPGL
jgi:hypothetical protein